MCDGLLGRQTPSLRTSPNSSVPACLLLSMTPYGTGYPFGLSRSVILALFPPTSLALCKYCSAASETLTCIPACYSTNIAPYQLLWWQLTRHSQNQCNIHLLQISDVMENALHNPPYQHTKIIFLKKKNKIIPLFINSEQVFLGGDSITISICGFFIISCPELY